MYSVNSDKKYVITTKDCNVCKHQATTKHQCFGKIWTEYSYGH